MSLLSEFLSATPLRDTPDTPGAPLPTLIAVDNSEEARAAVRFAGALESGGRIRPRVIVLEETFPIQGALGIAVGAGPVSSTVGDAIQTAELRGLRARLTEDAPGAVAWPLRVAAGDPATAILDEVCGGDVRLVMMGLRHYSFLAGVIGDDVALDVLGGVHEPVLGVTEWLHHVPRRVIVGVDFREESSRAAALACRFVAGGGTLTLAYVDGSRSSDVSDRRVGPEIVHEGGIAAAFARLTDSLPLLPSARVETVTLSGSPTDALLECVDRVSADLIVLGRRQHVPIRRALLGRVTTSIVRDGRCSVLVLPG
jgi:nucleotide-binding universal stress UspA family protein